MSSWQGKGAEILGLKGDVKEEELSSLLHGALSTGQQLVKDVGNVKIVFRPGYDLTFSAPT